MACMSPSPSGRRLSELLEEKQEPFLLDIHLLEKGCPSSLPLDDYETATCWSAPGNTAVLKRLASKKNKAKAAASSPRGGKKKPVGILRLLLSKILQSTVACSRRPPALQYCDSFKTAAVVALRLLVLEQQINMNAFPERECMRRRARLGHCDNKICQE